MNDDFIELAEGDPLLAREDKLLTHLFAAIREAGIDGAKPSDFEVLFNALANLTARIIVSSSHDPKEATRTFGREMLPGLVAHYQQQAASDFWRPK